MPILRFTHGDEVRDLDVTVMLMSEAESCESLTGWTEDEWRDGLTRNKVQAVRFAWWLAGKRAGVEERYGSVDLDLRRLRVEAVLTDEERAEAEAAGDAGEGVDADLPTGPGDDREDAA